MAAKKKAKKAEAQVPSEVRVALEVMGSGGMRRVEVVTGPDNWASCAARKAREAGLITENERVTQSLVVGERPTAVEPEVESEPDADA